jgi:hypothetical protein
MSQSKVLVQDLFNTAAAGTLLSAETPAIGPAPAAGIGAGNELVIFSTANQQATPAAGKTKVMDVYTPASGSPNCTASSLITFNAFCDVGLVCRYQDSNNYWYLCQDRNAGLLKIVEVQGGVFTTKASAAVSTASDTLVASCSGNGLTATLVGANVTVSFSSADFDTMTAFGMAAGLINNNAANAVTLFQTFTLTTPKAVFIFNVGDAECGRDDPISDAKLYSRPCFAYSRTGTIGADKAYFNVHRAGSALQVRAKITEAIATGGDRTVTIDVQRSTGGGAFSSILGSTIVFTSASALLLDTIATISQPTLAAGDVLLASVAVAGAAGAQAQGLAVSILESQQP